MERFIICRKEVSGETYYDPKADLWCYSLWGNCLWFGHPGSDLVASLSTNHYPAYVRKLTLTLGEVV